MIVFKDIIIASLSISSDWRRVKRASRGGVLVVLTVNGAAAAKIQLSDEQLKVKTKVEYEAPR